MGEGLDVGHVLRRERWGQLDHHLPGIQVHQQQVGRIRRAPVGVRRGLQDLLRAAIGRGRRGQARQQAGEGKRKQSGTAWRHGGPLQEVGPILAQKRPGDHASPGWQGD